MEEKRKKYRKSVLLNFLMLGAFSFYSVILLVDLYDCISYVSTLFEYLVLAFCFLLLYVSSFCVYVAFKKAYKDIKAKKEKLDFYYGTKQLRKTFGLTREVADKKINDFLYENSRSELRMIKGGSFKVLLQIHRKEISLDDISFCEAYIIARDIDKLLKP